MRYFKKLNPRNPIQLSGGFGHVKFDTLDNLVGYFATDNSGVLNEFNLAKQQQRGGIIEISQEEFEREYAQKKRSSPGFRPKPLNREELSPGVNTLDTALKPVPVSRPQAPVAALAEVAAINGSDIRRQEAAVPPPPLAPLATLANQVIAPPDPVEPAAQAAEPKRRGRPPRTAKISDIKKGTQEKTDLEKKSSAEPLT